MNVALRRLVWFAAGVVLSFALMEAALRLMPVSVGLHRTTDGLRWPLQNTDARLTYSYSTSWAMLNAHRGVTNNYGHVAPFDYRKDSRPIVVLGDSYIESLMNDYRDTLQGQLGEMLGAQEAVYGLGASGLSASDYVALSRMARDEFSPSGAVILITDGDLSESLLPGVGNYYLSREPDGFRLRYEPVRGDSLGTRIRKIVGDIAVHRYFQVNLQFSLDRVASFFEPARPASQRTGRSNTDLSQRAVVDWFLAELPGSLGLAPECIVLLLDADRYGIYRREAASTPKDDPGLRRYLVERAGALGFKTADLDPLFRERYLLNHIKFDHWPIDRHWNRVGHGVAASAAHQLLFQSADTQRACLAGKSRGTV
jgi:hypothetical protein